MSNSAFDNLTRSFNAAQEEIDRLRGEVDRLTKEHLAYVAEHNFGAFTALRNEVEQLRAAALSAPGAQPSGGLTFKTPEEMEAWFASLPEAPPRCTATRTVTARCSEAAGHQGEHSAGPFVTMWPVVASEQPEACVGCGKPWPCEHAGEKDHLLNGPPRDGERAVGFRLGWECPKCHLVIKTGEFHSDAECLAPLGDGKRLAKCMLCEGTRRVWFEGASRPCDACAPSPVPEGPVAEFRREAAAMRSPLPEEARCEACEIEAEGGPPCVRHDADGPGPVGPPRPTPAYCQAHQHYKWCEHNGGVLGPTGYEAPGGGERLRCRCCGHPPHDDRAACDHPEPTWHTGKCRCAGSGKRSLPLEGTGKCTLCSLPKVLHPVEWREPARRMRCDGASVAQIPEGTCPACEGGILQSRPGFWVKCRACGGTGRAP